MEQIRTAVYMTCRLLILFVLVALCICPVSNLEAADENASLQAEASKPDDKPKIGIDPTVQPKKIDAAGEKIGRRIEELTGSAAAHIGGWINAKVVFGITWLKLLFCLALLFLVAFVERMLRMIIHRRKAVIPEEEESHPQPLKNHLLNALDRPLSLFVWTYGIYIALTPIFIHFHRPEGINLVHLVAQKVADFGGSVALIWFIFRLVAIVDDRLQHWAAGTDSTIDDMLAPLVGKTLRIFIVIIGVILIIQNLTGVEIGPLLASLGIGGLAVALAARESIANFFGTLTILFDKPFQVGQRILIGGTDGMVESVGFRSTRIRTLSGHLVTIPNEKVVSSPVENIGMRPHIRWLTNITITYDTPPDKVEKAVQIVRDTLDRHEGMNEDFPPRVYFNGFNDWSLNILVIAWYHPPNYWDMQAWLQRTCLTIMRQFEMEGIEFAFPTRTVYLANDDRRQLALRMLKGEPMEHSGPDLAVRD